MDLKGPRDLPDFRLWLMGQWAPGSLFDRLAQLQTVEVINGEPVVNFDDRVQRAALPEAELWWVTEDMTALVEHSSRTLPETTLTEELIPARCGLIAFASPLVGTQYETGEPISTDVLVWVSATYRRTGEPGVSITSYHHVHVGDEMGNANQGYRRSDMDFWSPTGTTTWIMGSNTEETSFAGFQGDVAREVSQAEDRRWLAATWLLASQPLTSSTIQPAERPAGRRSKRANVASDVRVVDLRPRAAKPVSGDGNESRIEHDHRWLVAGPNGDGFWRQQACGPGWSQRRPKWIYPYEAGPKDKPLKVRDTVRVLRGGDRQ